MEAIEEVKKGIEGLENLAVAFSGGVDSSLLVYLAHQILGDKMVAMTMRSPYISGREVREAIEFAKTYGIPHEIIDVTVDDAVKTNPEDRCYLCKKAVFTKLIEVGKQMGFSHFADGTNHDDLGEYRPGLRALKELGVISPLTVLRKHQIRYYSKELGLPTGDKPSYACLLTRLPHDYKFTQADLETIEWAENLLIAYGYANVRGRYDGANLRIELPYDSMSELLKNPAFRELIKSLDSRIKGQISLDLRGLRKDVLA